MSLLVLLISRGKGVRDRRKWEQRNSVGKLHLLSLQLRSVQDILEEGPCGYSTDASLIGFVSV